ncbi:hypothetical protein ACHAXT_010024 [Thalassiosira profunda]
MSEEPKTSSAAAEPKLCKMGCGFFGSNATGDCCSKCWASIKPKDDPKDPEKAEVAEPAEKSVPKTDAKEAASPPPSAEGEAKEATAGDEGEAKAAAAGKGEVPVAPSPKKKKKKKGYKNLMKDMLEGSGESDEKKDKEEEKLKKMTGGGHFVKADDPRPPVVVEGCSTADADEIDDGPETGHRLAFLSRGLFYYFMTRLEGISHCCAIYSLTGMLFTGIDESNQELTKESAFGAMGMFIFLFSSSVIYLCLHKQRDDEHAIRSQGYMRPGMQAGGLRLSDYQVELSFSEGHNSDDEESEHESLLS